MKTAIVTGGTKKDVAAMAVLALNLQETNKQLADELIIFHDGISDSDQKIICKIMPARFIKYKCPVSKLKLYQNPSIRYFSTMLFCKFECFKLLDEYDAVVWTDYDVLIKDSIQEILQKECGFYVVANGEMTLQSMFHSSVCKRDMDAYDMQGECITTPLFVMRKDIGIYMKYYEWCYKALKEYYRDLYLAEQCIFSMLVQKFHIPYSKIDLETYVVHPKDDSARAKILHAYGQPKFWNGIENTKWEKYYTEWLNMGGKDYYKKRTKKC